MRRIFRRRERGSVSVMAALAFVPLLLAVGVGTDLGRAYLLRVKLAHALDAAGLAAGSTGGEADQVGARARAFFDANFRTGWGRTVSFDVRVDGDVITLDATARLDTSLMSLAGHDTMDVAATTEITREIRGLELAMVLDNTGSMNTNDNIGALRDAASLLTDILFGARAEHPLLKVGLVPYSASVNPGAEAATLVDGATYAPGDKTGWKGCVIERAAPHTHADTPASAAKWRRYLWGPAVDNNYNINKPSTIYDDPGDGNAGTGPNLGCPTPITPLTSVKAEVETAIQAMHAWSRGGTLGDIGMAWGQRILSPEPPFTQGAPWDDPEWTKAAILMTDGNNQVYKLGGSSGRNRSNDSVNSDYTGYGRLDQYGLVGTTSINAARNVANARMAALCEEMKGKGIVVYAITFTSGISESTKDIFRACASDPDKYFDAPTQNDLKSAFKTVANQLSNLRISR